MVSKAIIYCAICDREFKMNFSAFAQDLHIRRYHMQKVIEDAVKKYTKEIIAGEYTT